MKKGTDNTDAMIIGEDTAPCIVLGYGHSTYWGEDMKEGTDATDEINIGEDTALLLDDVYYISALYPTEDMKSIDY